MKKAFLVLLALLHLGLGAFFVIEPSSKSNAGWSDFPLDDSWILMVYARAIAEHGAPYYNDGQLEAGFSSPLWMLLGAGVHLLHRAIPAIDLVLAMKLLGVAIAFLASWAVFALAQRLGAGLGGAMLAAVFHAIAPQLAFAQVSGMEVSLAGGLGVFALVALHDGFYGRSGWAMALAYWARPEMGLLFLVVLLVVSILWRGAVLRERRGDFIRLAAPFLLLAIIWALTCYLITGGIFPTTATAKVQSQPISKWANFLTEVLWPSPSNFLLSGAVLTFAGYAMWLRNRSAAALAAIIFPWIFFLAIGATRGQPKGTDLWFYFLRYGLPGLPLLFVAMGAGFGFLWSEIQEPGKRRLVFRGLAIAFAGLALVLHPQALAARAVIYSQNCKNIQELQVRIGHWLAKNTPPDAVITSHDAGATRYFGQRPLVDSVGLNDHRIAADRTRRGMLQYSPQFLAEFMKERRSEYLVMVPTFFPQLVEHRQFGELFQLVFENESKPYTLGGSPKHSKMNVYRLLH